MHATSTESFVFYFITKTWQLGNSELQFCLLFYMGMKHGLSHEGRNID